MKGIKKYLKKRKKNINSLLKTEPKNYTQDTFHLLRVEIKQLKAVLCLLGYNRELNESDQSKPDFELIFKQAGKVRNIQVEQSILNQYFDYELLLEYQENLRLSEIKEKETFLAILNDTIADNFKIKNGKINPLLEKTTEENIDSYIQEQKNKIETTLNEDLPLKKENAHNFRKLLKAYLYIQECLNPGKKNKPSENNYLITKMLGEWHDYEIVIKHLNEIIASKGINSKEIKLLEHIREIFIARNELLLDKINVTIKTLNLN